MLVYQNAIGMSIVFYSFSDNFSEKNFPSLYSKNQKNIGGVWQDARTAGRQDGRTAGRQDGRTPGSQEARTAALQRYIKGIYLSGRLAHRDTPKLN